MKPNPTTHETLEEVLREARMNCPCPEERCQTLVRVLNNPQIRALKVALAPWEQAIRRDAGLRERKWREWLRHFVEETQKVGNEYGPDNAFGRGLWQAAENVRLAVEDADVEDAGSLDAAKWEQAIRADERRKVLEEIEDEFPEVAGMLIRREPTDDPT